MKKHGWLNLWIIGGVVAVSANAAAGAPRALDYQVYPVDRADQVAAQTSSATAAAEKHVYSNTEGHYAVEFPAGQLVADDLTLTVAGGCPLTRYTFQMIGRANPYGCGGVGMTCGPLRADFALYDGCPGAGGVPIAGTAGCASTEPGGGCFVLPDADALAEITFMPSSPVSLPSSVWLGISMSRPGAGVIVGAPALKGFSSDMMDTINFPCDTTLGGFPENPHSSFHAELYADATCADTFLTYQNIGAVNTGVGEGSHVCIADDITLNRTCDMVAMEIAVRGIGRYDVELRRAAVNGPVGNCNDFRAFGVSSVPGTRFAFVSPSDGPFVFRKNFDPPIPLPTENLFVVLMGNNVNAKWVLTGKDASIGSTDASYYVFEGTADGGTWNATRPSGNGYGGFHITITCAGTAPVGACCDQYFRDEANEAVCRDVPEINCAFPPKGSRLRPAWAEGISCRVCAGGDRDGAACADDAACPGGTCVDNDPFMLPCGVSACCELNGECQNLTLNECNSLPPIGPGRYDLGQFCSSQRQFCPKPACLFGEGDCFLPRPRLCNGGPDDGLTCSSDASCSGDNNGTCDVLPAGPLCLGGDRADRPCATDLDCIPGGFCTAHRCSGGARAGESCRFDRDCRESFCKAEPGCNDPLCCSQVCADGPFAPDFSWYCCEVEWDELCAALAQQVCDRAPSNEHCAPGEITSGAVEIKVNGLSVSTDVTFLMEPPFGDPICCNGGQRRCVGGCADGEVCNGDVDCLGAVPGYCEFGGDPLTGVCSGGCNAQAQCVTPGSTVDSKAFCVGGSRNDFPCAPRCAAGPNLGAGCGDRTACSYDGVCSETVCVGGAKDGQVCGTSVDCEGFANCTDQIDCPRGFCMNDFCEGAADGFCAEAQPEPGAPGIGSVWYYFTVPDGVGDTLDVEVSTCGSTSPARDSMVQVYAIEDNDSGLCTETGRCAGDDSICNVVAQDCTVGTICEEADVPCSIAAQDCPTGTLCTLNKTRACDSLTLIGCNDDAPDGCGDITQARNSKLCLPNLRRGDTYYILVAAKSETTRGRYRVVVRSVSACTGEAIGTCVSSLCVGGAFDGDACVADTDCAFPVIPANDSCPFAEDLADLDGDLTIIQRFNVGGATQDCRAPSCLSNMKNDVWYRYTAPATGRLLVSTCGGSNATTPDTELIIYDGCDCGAGLLAESIPGPELCCSAIGDPFTCLPGSECDIRVVAGNCYLMRLGDNGGTGAKGDMSLTLVPELCPPGTVRWVDPRSGTLDARQAKDCANGASATGIDTFIVRGPASADPACWSLCEAGDGGLGPNHIASVVEGAAGVYTITLTRPMTPGTCTTITYDPTASGGPAQTAKFSFLPADVNADGTAGPSDILELIDILNGVAVATWGQYSTDTDRSGATWSSDILGVIDLLNGGTCFTSWNGVTIETGDTCGVCPVATP